MALPDKLKAWLHEVARGSPGKRFQERYLRVHSRGGWAIPRKAFFMGGGAIVVAAGVFFLPAPGPGMVIIAFGAGMIAQESLAMARFLDWVELRGRRVVARARSRWRKLPSFARASMIAAGAAIAAGFMYLSYVVVVR